MKRLILILTILDISSLAYSQDNKWSIAVVASPNFYTIPVPEFSSQEYNANIGLSIGADAYYSLNKKLDLGLGLSFRTINYQVDYNFNFRDAGDPNIPRQENMSAGYLETPFTIRWRALSKGKMTVSPIVGLNASFLLSADQKTTYEDNSVREADYLNTSLLSCVAGIEASYQLNKNISLKLAPRFNYYFNTFDPLASVNPTLFQTQIGFEYYFSGRDNKQ